MWNRSSESIEQLEAGSVVEVCELQRTTTGTTRAKLSHGKTATSRMFAWGLGVVAFRCLFLLRVPKALFPDHQRELVETETFPPKLAECCVGVAD